MILLVGLGNPGREYAQTRHNIGFLALDTLAARHGIALESLHFRARVGTWKPDPARPSAVLVKPQTFMNASGEAVQPLLSWYKLTPAQMIVVVDDLDLPFGHLRLRLQGSAGGHNGLRSLIQHVGTTAFPRLRVGIGRPTTKQDTRDYVLHPFSPAEQAVLPTLTAAIVDVLEACLRDGVQQTMNIANATPLPPGLEMRQ